MGDSDEFELGVNLAGSEGDEPPPSEAGIDAGDDALEFDLIEARGDDLPWDSPLRRDPPSSVGGSAVAGPAGLPPMAPAAGLPPVADPARQVKTEPPGVRPATPLSVIPPGLPEPPDLDVRPSRPPGAQGPAAHRTAEGSRAGRQPATSRAAAEVPGSPGVPAGAVPGPLAATAGAVALGRIRVRSAGGGVSSASSARMPAVAPPARSASEPPAAAPTVPPLDLVSPDARSSRPAGASSGAAPGSLLPSLPGPPGLPSLEPAAPSVQLRSPAVAVGSAGGGGALSAFEADGGSLSWEWEDGLGDPAAAQLNVAQVVTAEDDVPWPRCRTPEPDEFSIDPLEAKRVGGFGSAPDGWLSAPGYFLRARKAAVALAGEQARAQEHLRVEEKKRDRLLSELTLSLRTQLAQSERLSALLREADRFEALIEERRRAFAEADQEGERRLAAMTAEVSAAEDRLRELGRETAARRLEGEAVQRELDRATAQLKRLDIERRNVAAQARAQVPVGENMPPDLGLRYLELGRERERAERLVLERKDAQRDQLAGQKVAEDAERRARAECARLQASRDALLAAQQGTSRTYASSLDEAESERLLALAEAGRAIIELKGEVAVSPQVRRQLVAVDQGIREAARALEVCVQAHSTLDAAAFARGKHTLIAVGVLLLLGLSALMFGRY